ncbi:MAG: HAMP domain-containing protein [Solirubrobacterales bacterium]|nr:HAMP domain-containing protein [Solirubrobacterales bacterium]
MSAVALRLVPRRWWKLSERSARLRLTVLYSGMFLLLGTILIAVILLFVRSGAVVNSSARAVAVSPSSSGAPVQDAVTQQHLADLARLLAVSWFTLALTAVASAPLGWFAAGRMLRPLRQMTTAARAISAGNLHDRLALDGPHDEFRQLGDTIDDLLARLETAFAAQRRFVANAAHELRTPLTLERTLLQVALADPNANATSLRATCEELLAAGRNQERLLEALLTLATSERGLEYRETLDLASLGQRALAQAETSARGLDMRTRLSPVSLRGDRALIERLIANLLDNAIAHNHAGGWIEIETAPESDRAVVRVANSGPVIYPDEVERLFEPFQRGAGERTAADGHYGLGLSIARAIVRAHDGEISAAPQPAGGLAVTVRLPAVTATI